MRELEISTESLCRTPDASSMVAQFLAGVIVGVLLGLALMPFLRSWILWRRTNELAERDR
jgi:F0F1-type ATP synthase assembly protein I